jgi:hypothetical protein
VASRLIKHDSVTCHFLDEEKSLVGLDDCCDGNLNAGNHSSPGSVVFDVFGIELYLPGSPVGFAGIPEVRELPG